MESKHPISICIITKNECDILQQCLEKLSPYAQKYGHEIVIVDTGSTDNTIEMCRTYTDSIYEFAWIQDFSAARNFAASKAKYDWILCIDSDEMTATWNENDIQSHIQHYPYAVGTIIQRNTCGYGNAQYICNDPASRFYHRNYYCFERPIHEQLKPLAQQERVYRALNIVVNHMAYAGTPEELQKKAERNISMLKADLENNPHNPYTLFQLGQAHYMIGDFESALHYYDLGLYEDVDPNLSYVRTMVNSFGYTLLELKQFKRALDLANVYDIFGNRADFVFLMGMIYLNNGLFQKAIDEFKRATTFSSSEVDGANSYRAWHNLGVIHECLGYQKEAITYYSKCGDFAPAKERLQVLRK